MLEKFFVTGKNAEALKVFEFASENSNVEFALASVESKGGIQVSILRTDHKHSSVGVDHLSKLEVAGFKIKDLKHSHPGGPSYPSGFDNFGKIDTKAARKGDLNTAERYPSAKHSVYDTKTKKYTNYDKNKAYPPK